MWKFKSIDSISNEEKDSILNVVFNSILDNNYSEDMIDEIIEYLETKGYLYFK